jgi:hypothetical protein
LWVRNGWNGNGGAMADMVLQNRIGSLILAGVYLMVALLSLTGKIKNPLINLFRYLAVVLGLVCAIRILITAIWNPLENLATHFPYNLPLWFILCCILIPPLGGWLRYKFGEDTRYKGKPNPYKPL